MPDEYDMRYSPDTLAGLGKLALQMKDNPKVRARFLRMIKEHAPNYNLPPDLQISDLEARLAEKDSKHSLDAAQREANQKQEAQRRGLLDGTLIAGRKYDDAQVKEIEAIMVKYGLGDYEPAAKLYAADMSPARPSGHGRPSSSSATWTLPEIPGLFEDPIKAAREAAYAAVDELRGRA